MKKAPLKEISKLLRYYILKMTTAAGSGHATSSLSAVELMAALCFGGTFRYDPQNPNLETNDRLIFSKGHASPLLYALYTVAGAVNEADLTTYRMLGSPLEGHPTPNFEFCEAATGSLGQGLSIGFGMALAARLDKLPYRTFVLLGDSEMSEGSVWEAIQLASHYRLDNLIGIIDVNRLGQRGETMYGHSVDAYATRLRAFGWETIQVDGHNLEEIARALTKIGVAKEKPLMIIAKTIKGKGVSFLEDKNGWHGIALDPHDFERALKELEPLERSIRAAFAHPPPNEPELKRRGTKRIEFDFGKPAATREAYGAALVALARGKDNLVVLDAEVSNSTYAQTFQKEYPERFFEMYIAEQNMVGAAVGLARRGKLPFVSTFAAFFTRAADQIRMSSYSKANVKFVGSHCGVSIGEDGPSQMGLEDLSLFRSVLGSVVLYPADARATYALVHAAAAFKGIVYLRTTRAKTPALYAADEEFAIGGSKTVRGSHHDRYTIVTAGITLFEALEAADELKKKGVFVRVIDAYSIKPLDERTLMNAARETRTIITVEDHYASGGLGEAVSAALSKMRIPIERLAVTRAPRSGAQSELLDYEEISKSAIIKAVLELEK